jgi:hypothetical protein
VRQGLLLRLLPDDEWTCGLDCEASYDGFAGRGHAWFNRDEIRTFCDALDSYPLPTAGGVLTGGYCEQSGEHLPTLALKVQPEGSLGQLQLIVELADFPAETQQGRTQILRRSIVCMPLDYATLRVFVARMRLLLSGGAPDFQLDIGSSA